LSEGGVTYEKSQLLFSNIGTNVWSQNTFVTNRSEDTARTTEKFERSQGTWNIALLPLRQKSGVLGSYFHYRLATGPQCISNHKITALQIRFIVDKVILIYLFYLGSN